jgi:hypothetical protein
MGWDGMGWDGMAESKTSLLAFNVKLLEKEGDGEISYALGRDS